MNKENIPSRAYISFKTEDLLTSFSRGYDGHLFRDKAGKTISQSKLPQSKSSLSGNESTAVVEFAPFQKVPSEKKKVDSRIASIEKGRS